MSNPLNLATRPFRNERLPRLLLGLAWFGMLVLSSVHLLAARQLLPGSSEGRVLEAERLEAKLQRMATRATSGEAKADPEQLKLWAALKELVDRRAFSWTGLLARLEQVIPEGVRIVSLAPKQAHGRLAIDFEAVARTQQDGLALLSALEARPEFSEVYPLHVEDADGLRKLRCTMVYDPDAQPAPVVAEGVQAADGGQP